MLGGARLPLFYPGEAIRAVTAEQPTGRFRGSRRRCCTTSRPGRNVGAAGPERRGGHGLLLGPRRAAGGPEDDGPASRGFCAGLRPADLRRVRRGVHRAGRTADAGGHTRFLGVPHGLRRCSLDRPWEGLDGFGRPNPTARSFGWTPVLSTLDEECCRPGAEPEACLDHRRDGNPDLQGSRHPRARPRPSMQTRAACIAPVAEESISPGVTAPAPPPPPGPSGTSAASHIWPNGSSTSRSRSFPTRPRRSWRHSPSGSA